MPIPPEMYEYRVRGAPMAKIVWTALEMPEEVIGVATKPWTECYVPETGLAKDDAMEYRYVLPGYSRMRLSPPVSGPSLRSGRGSMGRARLRRWLLRVLGR